MALSLRSARPRLTLAVLVLTSLTAVTADLRSEDGVIDGLRGAAREAIAPVQSAVDAGGRPVRDLVQAVRSQDELETENARLRAELDQARNDVRKAADVERERDALLAAAGLESVAALPRVGARVVAGSRSNFDLTLEIDRGRRRDVEVDMPVVSGGGLIGRVVQASDHRATVRLISDPQSNVGVRLPAGDVGLAGGQGRDEPLDIDLIDPRTVVEPGEVVVTSGTDPSYFPPGVPVGRVRDAEVRPGDLAQQVRIDPVVDLQRLALVEVVQWRPLSAGGRVGTTGAQPGEDLRG